MKKIVLAAVAAALIPGTAFAAGTDTEAGVAIAEVVSPITLTHTSGAALNFGLFTSDTGGAVSVSAAGVRSFAGDIALVGTAASADAFTVAGEAGRSFTISTTGGNLTNGGTTMTFTTVASASSATLDGSGAAGFTVGGALNVPANPAEGTYNGSYNATVTYQ